MKHQIIISGGGYTGLLTALCLLKQNQDCIIIEKQTIEDLLKDDGRSFAISKITIDLLKKLDVWNELESHVEFIKSVYCFENNQTSTLHLNNSNLLCGMLSSYILKKTLFEKLKSFQSFQFYDNYSWKEIEFNQDGKTCNIYSEFNNEKKLDFSADILISTEGKNSQMIDYFNLKQIHHDYEQNATIFNIEHEFEHNNIALEKFFPDGAIAILSLKKINNINKSAIVWINKKIHNDYINNLDEDNFTKLLNEKINFILGSIKIENFEAKKTYPLKLSFLKKYYHNNIIFLGDINHAIHPIAGQGLNLIIRDIEKLTEIISNNSNMIDAEKISKQFMRKRIIQNLSMIGFTHLLVKIFEGENKLLKNIRNFGIDILEKTKIMKIFF